MEDKVSANEARDILARRIVDSAAKNGQNVSYQDAQRRVGTAMERGDLKRSNQNK